MQSCRVKRRVSEFMQQPNETVSAETYEPLISARLLRRTMIVVILIAILTILLNIGGRWYGERMATGGYNVGESLKTITIAGNRMIFPANTIRFESQRTGGSSDRLDLYVVWPELAGYSLANRQQFNDSEKSGNLIFLSVMPKTMQLDMTARLAPIYRKLTTPGMASGINGLEVLEFTEDSRYVDEILYVGAREDRKPFVVRCLKEEKLPSGSRSCMRDINIGQNLSVTYRFSNGLLPQWQELDKAINNFIEKAMLPGTAQSPA